MRDFPKSPVKFISLDRTLQLITPCTEQDNNQRIKQGELFPPFGKALLENLGVPGRLMGVQAHGLLIPQSQTRPVGLV